MRVEVDGNADFLFECRNKLGDSSRMTEAGHIFYAKNMCSHFFQLIGLIDVVFKRIFGTVGIGDVTGIANGSFAYGFAMLANCFHGDLHIRQIV